MEAEEFSMLCRFPSVLSLQGERGCTVDTRAELLGQHVQCCMIQMGGEPTIQLGACSLEIELTLDCFANSPHTTAHAQTFQKHLE